VTFFEILALDVNLQAIASWKPRMMGSDEKEDKSFIENQH